MTTLHEKNSYALKTDGTNYFVYCGEALVAECPLYGVALSTFHSLAAA